jgi:hypothetical protein
VQDRLAGVALGDATQGDDGHGLLKIPSLVMRWRTQFPNDFALPDMLR